MGPVGDCEGWCLCGELTEASFRITGAAGKFEAGES